jgi:hypothetical protein
MRLRTARPRRALAATLCSLGLGVTTTGVVPADAGATTPWSTTFLHQTPVVTLSPNAGELALGLRAGGSNGDGVTTTVALYPKITTRYGATPISSGLGSSDSPLASTGSFPLDCRSGGVAELHLTLTTTNESATDCNGARSSLALTCHGAGCDGVYPLSVTSILGAQRSVLWSLVTIRAAGPVTALHVALVFDDDSTDPSSARRVARALHALAEATTEATVAEHHVATVDLVREPWAQGTLSSLRDFVGDPSHHVVAALPTGVNAAGLRASGLLSHLRDQSAWTLRLLGHVLATTNVGPDGPVVVSGAPSASDLDALARAGSSRLVLSESSLSETPSLTLHWGTPYVAGAATYVTTDGPLNALLNDATIEPARRAALAAGILSLLHYEAPYARTTRTVVLRHSLASSAGGVSALVSTLDRDPLVIPVSLDAALTPADVGGNANPTSRTLVTKGAVLWNAPSTQALGELHGDLASFADATTVNSPATSLMAGFLDSETRVPSSVLTQRVATLSNGLDVELGHFTIDEGSITLADAGTPLPITLHSTATYPLRAHLRLTAPNLRFPNGNVVTVRLSAATTSVRVLATAVTGSNATLHLELLSPDGQLVVTAASLQVRSAPTSVVGYALSIGSLLVIAWWWWRTTRRRSKGAHAR